MNEHGMRNVLHWLAAGIAAAVVVAGFWMVGSPAHNRMVAEDRQRIRDLMSLRSGIEQFYEKQKTLPGVSQNLGSLAGYNHSDEDPVTKRKYEYMATGTYSYQLCAEFTLASDQAELERSRYKLDDKGWQHGPGRHCFQLEIPEGDR